MSTLWLNQNSDILLKKVFYLKFKFHGLVGSPRINIIIEITYTGYTTYFILHEKQDMRLQRQTSKTNEKLFKNANLL